MSARGDDHDDVEGIIDFDTAPVHASARAVLRRARLVLVPPVLLAMLVFAFFQFFGSHVASSSFAPQSSGSALGALSGIAAQLGGKLPGVLGGDAGESLDFYATLMRSPQLLTRLAENEYEFRESDTDSTMRKGDLIKFYGIRGDTPEERRRRIVEKLQSRVSVSVNRMGNVVNLRVKAPWPGLAMAVNRQMLALVNEFNLQQRQSAAGAQRRFLEARVEAAKKDLTSVEDSLRLFMEANRVFSTDPRLALEAARLQRQVDLRQGVYATLTQSLEESRIEEVRNTPVITVIDQPELYTKRSRKPLVMAALALVLCLFVTIAVAVLLEAVSADQRRHPERWMPFDAAVRRLRGRS